MTLKNDESHALIFVIPLYIIAVKDMATHCLLASCLNLFALPWLKSAHNVLLGSTTSYIVDPGFSSTSFVILYNSAVHTLHIVALHLSERNYHLTETFILFCQPLCWQINYTQ